MCTVCPHKTDKESRGPELGDETPPLSQPACEVCISHWLGGLFTWHMGAMLTAGEASLRPLEPKQTGERAVVSTNRFI